MTATAHRARDHHRRQGRRRPRRRLPRPAPRGQEGHGRRPVGSVIEIWSTDPVTKTDIGAWSGKVGHDFLGVLEADGYDRVFVIRRK